jgi:hypothetical protein
MSCARRIETFPHIMRTQYISRILLVLLISCSAFSCSNSDEQETLDCAETIMETSPDTAMMLLSSVDKERLSSNKQKARYSLLMSMALDKNYIDTTTFDVLQPAIDYYLKKGTSNDKLRTYYYQGVIFQNQGNLDEALNSYIKGLAISNECTDSLTIARMYVAQGQLYNDLFDFDSYVNRNLTAANIYEKLSRKSLELDCILNALNGALIVGNENLCDSIFKRTENFSLLNENQQRALTRYKLSFALKFGRISNIDKLIHEQEENIGSINDVLNLALAYNKIGNNERAEQLLNYVDNSKEQYDTIKYLSISVPIYEQSAKYKEALSCYKKFSHKRDSIDLLKFEQKAQFIEDKHQVELKAQKKARHKNKIIYGCISGIAILFMGVIILFLLARSHKAKKELAFEKVKAKEAENAKLKSEKENLKLENKNLQLERNKKALEAENLAHRVETLEFESDYLKALIDTKEGLPIDVQNAIKVRIEMLNSLLASYITDNYQYEKSYDVWIKELTENTAEFMNSNRLAFQVSHPRFIKYFEDHNLTVDEINYVCLYAIGLRGKEVGIYMKKRSHVNTSSAIRKKLGIDKHETNIGIYVRKLLKNL